LAEIYISGAPRVRNRLKLVIRLESLEQQFGGIHEKEFFHFIAMAVE
jgi:hypothetical protein